MSELQLLEMLNRNKEVGLLGTGRLLSEVANPFATLPTCFCTASGKESWWPRVLSQRR